MYVQLFEMLTVPWCFKMLDQGWSVESSKTPQKSKTSESVWIVAITHSGETDHRSDAQTRSECNGKHHATLNDSRIVAPNES